jgi:hypothetical protein
VENDAGYVPRNFLTPLLQVNSYEELNALLRKACLADVHRHVRGKEAPVGCVLNAPFSIIQYNLHMPEYRRSLIEDGTILYSGYLQPSANTHKHRSQEFAPVGLDGCAQEISIYDGCGMPVARTYPLHLDPARWRFELFCSLERDKKVVH